jgi:HK97 family phage major capsid protein
MSEKEIKALRQELGEVVTQARNLADKAEKETRGFTDEESGQWEKLNDAIDSLKKRIDVSERANSFGQFANASAGVRSLQSSEGLSEGRGGVPAEKDEELRAFNAYLKQGMAQMPDELRDISKRALSVGTLNVGGYTVPQGFYNKLEVALKAFGGMWQEAEIIETDTGAVLPMPSFNYVNVLATIVSEAGAAVLDSSTPFGVVNLGSYTYRSPMLPISYEFLQDSAFGDSFVLDSLSGSIARAFNAHATTGTGTGQPKGIVTAATSGKVGQTGQTAAVIFDDFVDLIHSVDPAYRQQSKFMLHDSSLKVARKLKDSQNRPIFLPGYDGLGIPMPDSILGYGVTINQDMPTMAANAKSILFGNLNKYKIRLVKDVQVLRLAERYADQLQVGYMLFARMDGNLMDAGTNPVKFYQNSAT